MAEDYSSAVYCAIITHSGSGKRDGFVECKDDTVNPDGEGAWDTSLTEGSGQAPPPELNLLKAENVKLPWVVKQSQQWLSNHS